MSFTLYETLGQIDSFVNLSDGHLVRSVGQWLSVIDLADPTEYVLCVDSTGRFLIHRLDFAGYVVFPPAFVEEKQRADRFSSFGFSDQSTRQIPPQHYV